MSCRRSIAPSRWPRRSRPHAAGSRFLLARASRGRDVLPEQLRAAGGIVEQVVVYMSADVETADPAVAAALAAGRIDWVTVTSSSIARAIVGLFGEQLRRTRLASISPVTSQTLCELGYPPAVEAIEYTMAGLVEAIMRMCQIRIPNHEIRNKSQIGIRNVPNHLVHSILVFAYFDFEFLISDLLPASLHVLDALPCQSFNARRVVEDFDGYPAVVADFIQRPQDRHEVELAEARPLAIGIVGVKMGQPRMVLTNEIDHRRGFGRHRLAIQVQADLRRADPLDQFHRLGRRQEKVRLLRAQRLNRQNDAAGFQFGHDRRRALPPRNAMPSAFVIPSARFRCCGEPSTITRPPRSPHSQASSMR